MTAITLTFSFASESDALAFLARTAPTVAATPSPAPAPSKTETKPPAAAPAPAAGKAEGAIEYSVLQKAVFALAAKDKTAATEVAAALGVKTFKELPAERWPEALKAVNDKLAGLDTAVA